MYAQGKKGRVEAQQEGMERKKRLVARRMGCWQIFKQTPIDPCLELSNEIFTYLQMKRVQKYYRPKLKVRNKTEILGSKSF